MTKTERLEHILNYFNAQQPEITTELTYGSTFQLLCAVVLSAQCTDKRVNMVTPALFSRFPSAKEMAQAEAGDILDYIASVSYPNAKAGHLAAMAKKLVENFGGEVPETMDELTSLPGVGRKTANVMLSVAFGQGAMPVDTHVYRVSHRIGLVNEGDNTPLKVEKRLSKYIANDELGVAHHWLLLHGRYICKSRKPECEKCPITAACKNFSKAN